MLVRSDHHAGLLRSMPARGTPYSYAEGDQRVGQPAAAVEQDVLARLRLQVPHCLDHVAADDRRVAPKGRVGQGGRDDLLLDAVQHIAEGVACGQRLEPRSHDTSADPADTRFSGP